MDSTDECRGFTELVTPQDPFTPLIPINKEPLPRHTYHVIASNLEHFCGDRL